MKDKVFQKIDSCKGEMIAFLKELIQIDTTNPPGKNYKKIVQVLEKKCEELGLETKKYVVPKEMLDDPAFPRMNLIAIMKNKKQKTLQFNGHFDVVPSTDDWDAFNPTIKGNKFFGRGTMDMKGSLPCYIYAVKAIKELGIIPNINVEIAFVCDEETSGKLGTGYLINHTNPDYVISEGASRENIVIGSKGIIWFEIEVIGKASHAAYPQNGINSFEYASMLAVELLKLKESISKRRTKYKMKYEVEKSGTFVMGGLLTGGNKPNTVPKKTKFTIDRRVLPDEDFENAKKEVFNVVKIFKKMHKVKVNCTIINEATPVLVNPKDDFCVKLSDSIKNVIHKDANHHLISGFTDLRFYIMKGIPSLGNGPRGENYHGDDEYIEIDSMMESTKVYADLILSF